MVIGGGFAMAFVIGRFDLAMRGFGIAIPAIFSAFFLMKMNKHNYDFKNLNLIYQFNQAQLVLIFSILYIISIISIVINPYRPWYYFVVILALSLLVFIHIFSKKVNVNIVLLEIILIMINLSYSVTLNYPLYFGWTDIMGHLFFSEVTYLSGHIIPGDLSIDYTYFPLQHILIAESSILSSLSIKTSFFIIAAPIYAVVVIFIYYIFDRFTDNHQKSLLVCLLYSMFSIVIFYGTYVVTRTVAFVGFTILLYLLYRGKYEKDNSVIFKTLSYLILIFIILVHQVSIVQMGILFGILFICELIVGNRKYFSTTFFVLFNVSFIFYWFNIAYSFTSDVIYSHLRPKDYETFVIRSAIQSGNEWSFLLNNIDLSIFLFFALIGIGYILRHEKSKYTPVFALFSFATLILYVPSPLQMLFQTVKILRFDRFMLLVSPFMAFIMATGIIAFYGYLSNKNKLNKICSIILILLLFTGFVASSLRNNLADSDDFNIDSSHNYFSEKELSGLNHVSEYISFGSKLYTDYHVGRSQSNFFSLSDGLNLPYYENHDLIDFEKSSNYDGYILIRNEEFNEEGLIFASGMYYPTDENLIKSHNYLQQHTKIYSNSAIEIYL